MKYLFLLLISLNCFASNWMPLSKIQSQSSQAHQLESDCLKSGEQCLDVGNEPEVVQLGFFSLQDAMGDDFENPIWEAESEIDPCDGESACEIANRSKACPDQYSKFIDQNFSRIYCTKIIGYSQKVIGKSFLKDETAFNSYKTQKASAAQLEAGVNIALKLNQCGQRVIALMLVRNQPKGLTKPQVKQLVTTYKDIMSLLQSGSLATAKDEINAVSSDGVLVTAADKIALTQEIDKCLGI